VLYGALRPEVLRLLLFESVAALLCAGLVGWTSSLPFWPTLVLLILSWPAAGCVILRLARKSPLYEERPFRPADSLWRFAFFLPISGLVWWGMSIRFADTFAYVLLAGSAFGAVNGVIMEWEDTAPGGWLSAENEDSAQ
jgi:hypothetical protein